MSRRSRSNSSRRAARRSRRRSDGRRPGRASNGDRPASESRSKRLPWKIISVFDPDGTGADFSYTVGLAKLGHPELHMWARPTHGTDPGADFKLSPQDRCVILDGHAELLLCGELHAGHRTVRDMDAGMTEVHITVGDAVHPHTLEALGAQPGAQVLPLRWELIREPPGRPAPVSAAVANRIERFTLDWRSLVEDLGGSVRPRRIDTTHTQRYGPWTPALDAVRDAIGIVGAMGELSWCIDRLGDRCSDLGYSIAVAGAIARRHGRSGAFEAAKTVAFDDAHAAITTEDPLWSDMSDEEIQYFMRDAHHTMDYILSALYCHIVVLEYLIHCDGFDHDLSLQVHSTVQSVVYEATYPTGAHRADSGPTSPAGDDTFWDDADWPDAG